MAEYTTAAELRAAWPGMDRRQKTRFIAEQVFGWTWYADIPKDGHDYFVGWYLRAGRDGPWIQKRGDTWSPPTDTAAAWEVVRHVAENWTAQGGKRFGRFLADILGLNATARTPCGWTIGFAILRLTPDAISLAACMACMENNNEDDRETV